MTLARSPTSPKCRNPERRQGRQRTTIPGSKTQSDFQFTVAVSGVRKRRHSRSERDNDVHQSIPSLPGRRHASSSFPSRVYDGVRQRRQRQSQLFGSDGHPGTRRSHARSPTTMSAQERERWRSSRTSRTMTVERSSRRNSPSGSTAGLATVRLGTTTSTLTLAVVCWKPHGYRGSDGGYTSSPASCTVTVPKGGVVTCTYGNNDKPGSLTVIEQVSGGTGAAERLDDVDRRTDERVVPRRGCTRNDPIRQRWLVHTR